MFFPLSQQNVRSTTALQSPSHRVSNISLARYRCNRWRWRHSTWQVCSWRRSSSMNIQTATWNVTSATDTGYQDALVRELARLQLSITGITEARLTGAGIRRVENALILHSGGDTHINGVALVVLPPFVQALVSWKPISDRLLTARFAHKHGHFSVIVCYAPTEPSDDTAKENLYNQLSSLTQSVPPHDLLFILGDLTQLQARVMLLSTPSDPSVQAPGTKTPRGCWHTVACTNWSFLAHGSDAWISTAGHGCRTITSRRKKLTTFSPGSATEE